MELQQILKVAQYSTTRQMVYIVASWGEPEAYYHAIDIIYGHAIIINLSNAPVDYVMQTVSIHGL